MAVILALAKNYYDWHGRIRNSLELAGFYTELSVQYKHLVDDINYRRCWDDEFDARHVQLRTRLEKPPDDPYPTYSEKELRVIQKRIKDRADYRSWWMP